METILRIGFEREAFLVSENDSERVLEPFRYGLPHDEFGFLGEVRGEPTEVPLDAALSLIRKEQHMRTMTEAAGVMMRHVPVMYMDAERMAYFQEKYDHDHLRRMNFTANIYPDMVGSHHLGYFQQDGQFKLTSGLHIHFSRVNADGRIVHLPIYDIVAALDNVLEEKIRAGERIKGEFETKCHNGCGGFEYRSAPCDVNLEWLAARIDGIIEDLSLREINDG